MKKSIVALVIAAILSPSLSFAGERADKEIDYQREFVRGGQFRDFIKPLPIISQLTSEGIWGGDNVLPRDPALGIEASDWSYWGGNIIKDLDGRYHIAVCRWPESAGHDGWRNSEIAHAVADDPLGPYTVTGTIAHGHNPEVVVLKDGTYGLHIINGHTFSATKMEGPWSASGTMQLEARGFRNNNSLGPNLTIANRPDGSFLLMKKDGDMAVAQEFLGPYKMVSINNYKFNGGYAEDPVIWRSLYQYHSIYNHAALRKSAYRRSLDGIDWKKERGLPYDYECTQYEDGHKTNWGKFERPKVAIDDKGRASYLSLAAIDVQNKGADVAGDEHNSKHLVLPLVPERFVTIENGKPITEKTKKITVRIAGEDNFDPIKEVDINSLRFGSDSKVNYGGGCKPISYRADGADLIVEFKGENGLNRFDYDFKLLGETHEGDLVYGYALLEKDSHMAAKLIALPAQAVEGAEKSQFSGVIENMGFKKSEPQVVSVFENGAQGWRRVKDITVPALEPYEQYRYTLDGDATQCEYEVHFDQQLNYLGYWRTYDDTAAEYSGNWGSREGDQFYMGKERTTRKAGCTMKFTFTGNMARIYGTTLRVAGECDIFVDGELIHQEMTLCYGGFFGILYETDYLPYGEHTIELRTTNENLSTIDGFAVESLQNKRFFEGL